MPITNWQLVAQTVEHRLQCWRPGFDPWVGKIPWRKKWQPTPVLLPEKSHGQRSLVGCSPWGCRESDTTEWLYLLTYLLTYLPLWGLTHVLCSRWLSTSPRKFKVQSRNEAVCSGKTSRIGIQTDVFRSQFYEPHSCISSYLEKH